MTVVASRVTTKAALDACHTCAVTTFDASTVCSPGFFYPSRNELDRHLAAGNLIYAAVESGVTLGFAVVNTAGQVLWIKGQKTRLVAVGAALLSKVFADLGACFGFVHNDTFRATLASAAPNHLVDDGPVTTRLWWKA